MGLFDSLFGNKMKKVDTMTPQQKQLLNSLIQMLGPGGGVGEGFGESTDLLRQYLDPTSESVQQFTDPYMREFEQQTIPQLAERFAGGSPMGGGALSSSGFGQSLSAAGGNLQSQLAALRANLGQQAAGKLMGQYGGLSGQAMGAQPFGYMKPQQGFLPGLLGSYAQAGFPGFKGKGGNLEDAIVNYAPGSVI